MQKELSKNRRTLKKHVAAIHSTNCLTLLQRKIANALLFNAYPELLEKTEHQIHVRHLCGLIGYDSNDHRTVKQALIKLLSTVVEWNLIDKEKADNAEIWNASSIIADASICGPVCYYSYSKRMRELLYHPSLYGRINLDVQALFKSAYGLALYENCVRYQNIQKTPWLELGLFRKLMGVAENKYPVFRDLKKRVINKAVKEVNTVSSIIVNPTYKKAGRQINAVQFSISAKKDIDKSNVINKMLSTQGQQNQKIIVELQESFGFSTKQITDIFSRHSKEYVAEKMHMVKSSVSFTSGKIKNLAGYLIAALNGDYKKIPQNIGVPPRDYEKRRRFEMCQAAYLSYQTKAVYKIFKESSRKMQQMFLQEFKNHIGAMADHFKEYDFEKNPVLFNHLLDFFIAKHANLMQDIVSYEKFEKEYTKKSQDFN